MTPSSACIDLIKSFESLKLEAYVCPAGKQTIGWGHTAGVRPGDRIDQPEAERLLQLDLQQFSAAVARVVTVPVSQHQFDALVSFAFNAKGWAQSTLIKKLNAGDPVGAAAEFPRWVYAKVDAAPVVLKGLVRRRAAERKLFEG